MTNAFILQHSKVENPIKLSNPESVRFIVVDLFCGAGGTTTGFSKAKDIDGNPIAIIAACVNHDHKAIVSHWENHPEVEHFEEDITKMYGMIKYNTFFMSSEMVRLRRLVDLYRAIYPNAKVILWASLECTNFSKAKGGQPRDADSRTLANHLDRYIYALSPDYVQIENVVEFMAWGPMRVVCKKKHKADPKNGVYANSELKYIINKKTGREELAFTPIAKKNGQDFRKWESHINAIGYRSDWRELNSADFGAYTSRNRLFGCFAKDGLPIVWPEPTHSKTGSDNTDLFGGGLKKWNAVREKLDFDDEGESIFGRKKPLVENSLKRVYAGLIKEVAGGKSAFLVKYNSMNQKGNVAAQSIDDPSPVISCQGRLAVAKTSFISQSYIVKNYSGSTNDKISSIESPAPTITTIPHESLVSVKPFLTNYNHSSRTNSVDNPCPTIVTKDKLALTTPCFITKYYGNDKGSQSTERPLGTITTKDRFNLVQTNWLDKQYSGDRNHQSINQPAGSILANDKHCLMTAKGFLYNPSHGGHTMHIEQPCPTIIARQDKSPLYFIQYDIDPNVHIEIYEDDSETMVKIKEFMALYGISDIKMRMLKVQELKEIQGFPIDYKLSGNQTDQKKFIGNSVVPHVVQAWAEAQGEKLLKMVA